MSLYKRYIWFHNGRENCLLFMTCIHYSLIIHRLFHLVIEFLETKKRRSKWTKGSFGLYKAFFDEVRSYLLVNGRSGSASIFEILGQM